MAVGVHMICEEDVTEVAGYLARGFGYTPAFYLDLFDKLTRHPTPPGLPAYGYRLEDDGRLVGALLLIFTRIGDGAGHIRCHVTSWCVDPPYRPMASLYFARAFKFPDVTYLNVSARSWVRPIVEAQGFQKYMPGQFIMSTHANVLVGHRHPVDAMLAPTGHAGLSDFENQLLQDHAGYGCLSVCCTEPDSAHPFVFHPRPFRGIPGVQLVYCRSFASFRRCLRPLSRLLRRQGKRLLRVDSDGPLRGIPGVYRRDIDPRFCKGVTPHQGDLAYTQMVMCPFTIAASI